MKKPGSKGGGILSPVVVMLSILSLAWMAGCGMVEEEGPRSGLTLEEDTEVRLQQLDSFCTVDIVGHGKVDVENDYLPSVIACENGNAPMEALKAQAVAARTYAQFISTAENRALHPTTRDQVYNCSYAQVEQRHRDAVNATAGEVLTRGDRLIASFYVAGAVPSASSCIAGRGDNDYSNTERFVTYNQGRTGSGVRPTSLGHPANPANRGAKSQNGAACLANQGWSYDRILRFYYGDDARATVAPSSTCSGGNDGGNSGEVCAEFSSGGSEKGDRGPICSSPGQAPQILPRSAWNARPPRANRAPHTPNRIAVHHTVTPNNASDGAHWVRMAQKWHMDDNGWSDIGYHFLIAWDGTIYRGNPEERVGAHSGNYNTGNLGIALLGRFDTGQPSQAQTDSLTRLLRHLSDKYGIPLNRDKVKGHGEQPYQSTVCPGGNLRSKLDAIVQAASGDAVCQGTEPPSEKIEEYKYVRVTGVSANPTTPNDVVDGYEVDSIYVERAGRTGGMYYGKRVLCSPDVNNPNAALGRPDNMSCDDRTSTVAGVPVGADLIVEMSQPIRVGDKLHVVQHSYNPAMSTCQATGSAKITVSADGKIWKVLTRDNSGNWTLTLKDEHFIIDENDETLGGGEGFKIVNPRAGHWYTEEVSFSALATNPSIVSVDFLADNWSMVRAPAPGEGLGAEPGALTNKSDNFAFNYDFDYLGERLITAVAFDASGNEVARDEITITVTDYHGNIPKDREVIPPLPESGGDSAAAETLASEGGRCYHPSYGGGVARCNNGTGGSSIGYCWGYVKHAMIRAGYNVNLLAGAGPCSSYRYHASAYGFRCNADANPGTLRQMGFERINVPPSQAPRGAIINWDRGCNGFHSVHGHIEVSMGNGVACSDYCGNIRSGGQSCSSVYVPVSN